MKNIKNNICRLNYLNIWNGILWTFPTFLRNGEDWYNLRKLGHAIVHKNTSDFEAHGLFVGCEGYLENYMKDLREVVRKGDGCVDDLELRSYDIAVGGKF